MKTLEEIKYDYAVTQKFEHWIDLLECNSELEFEIDRHINEVIKIYARECLKLANKNLSLENHGVSDMDYGITNENNIIK